MVKGFLILLVTFVLVAILHFTILKIMEISEQKKTKFRKVFWYLYGFIFTLSGALNWIEKSEFNFIFFIQSLLGILVIILNLMGKIKTKH